MLIYFFFRTIVQTSERKFTCVCNECSRLSAKPTAPPILSKDSESRAQYKKSRLFFIVEAHPMLLKDSASREENKINANLFFLPNYRANE